MNQFEIIAAFLDDERVDPAALKDALSSDEGRQYLVDVVALREMTAERAPASSIVVTRVVAPRAQWVRRIAAAAAVVVCVIGAFIAGHRSAAQPSDDAALTPVSASERPGVRPAEPVSAPAPTSIIRFERGVDWTETSGGN